MTKAKEQLIPVLQNCSLADGMSEAEIRELLSLAQVRIREYAKGDIVFHEGEKPHCIYILLAGEVHILKDTFSGRQIFLSEIAEAGDMFGEVYEVLEKPYDMYVEAVKPTRVLEIASRLLSLDAGGSLTRSALLVQRNLMRIFARKAYFMASSRCLRAEACVKRLCDSCSSILAAMAVLSWQSAVNSWQRILLSHVRLFRVSFRLCSVRGYWPLTAKPSRSWTWSVLKHISEIRA